MQRAKNRPPGQRIRHDHLGTRREPDATTKALRVLVLSALAEGRPMTTSEVLSMIEVRLPRVLGDLAEQGEIEVRRHREGLAELLVAHYTLTAAEPAIG